MSKLENLMKELSQLTVLEAAEFAKKLEEHWGVSAAAPAAMMMSSGTAAQVEEKTEFDVTLKSIGGNKLEIIKTVREFIPSLGLTEAKALVESAPKVIKSGVSKDEAEKIKQALQKAGAEVEVK